MNNTIIIGAGPAGLSASITISRHGGEVLVIDEYMLAGGRLLGQLYEEPTGGWWNGITESKQLFQRAKENGVDVRLNTSVYDMEKHNGQWHIYTDKGKFTAKNVLLATGAAETPFAIPGWTLPGVMSVGAAQVMTNVHRVKPGNKGNNVGVKVLSSAIAMELQIAGIEERK